MQGSDILNLDYTKIRLKFKCFRLLSRYQCYRKITFKIQMFPFIKSQQVLSNAMPPSVLVGEDMSGRNKMRKRCCQHFKYIWVYQVFKWFSQIKIESYHDANFAISAWWHHKLRKTWHDDNGFQCSNQWSVGVLLCLDSFARVAKGLYRERRYLRSLVELWTPSWDSFTVGFLWLSAPSRENELGEEIDRHAW